MMQTSSSVIDLKNIRQIVAVASGKGGVGKSTVTINLAYAFARMGLKVGVMDADIYGPSIPHMMGIQPDYAQKKFQLYEKDGIKMISMGCLVPPDAPVIWRGPMVMGAVTQMLQDLDWGQLDLLLIDLPPGTGDIHLSICQKVSLTGAVVVSTPQDIALLDARKALFMFDKVKVPVLGIIENMSYFLCPHCQGRSEVFSHGGAHAEADKLGVPFLGEVPLNLSIREGGDQGSPIAAQSADPMAEVFLKLAEQLKNSLQEKLNLAGQGQEKPHISME